MGHKDTRRVPSALPGAGLDVGGGAAGIPLEGGGFKRAQCGVLRLRLIDEQKQKPREVKRGANGCPLLSVWKRPEAAHWEETMR